MEYKYFLKFVSCEKRKSKEKFTKNVKLLLGGGVMKESHSLLYIVTFLNFVKYTCTIF